MKAAILLSISAAIIVGCAPSPDIYGHWEGNRDWKALGTADENVARALAAVNLDLKPYGNFVLTEGGVPFEGTFVVSGSEIRLDVKTILRKPISVQPSATQQAALYEVKFENGSILLRAEKDRDWLKMTKVKLKE